MQVFYLPESPEMVVEVVLLGLLVEAGHHDDPALDGFVMMGVHFRALDVLLYIRWDLF